eukprot:XP_024302376.1 uncharacterized protein LOC112267968 [Homo sapiens]
MPGPQPPRAPKGESCGVPATKHRLRNLAQSCSSVPAAGLDKILGKARPHTRKSLASAVTLEQLSLQLGLPLKHAEPVLHSPMVLTQGPETTRRHLFLFRDWLVIAKQRSSKSYRVEQKLHLSGVQAVTCDREERQDGDKDQDLTISLGNSLVFMLASDPCVAEFPSSGLFLKPLHPLLTSILTCALRWLVVPSDLETHWNRGLCAPQVCDASAGC